MWNWIFANQTNERRVQTLIEKINATGTFVSTNEFSTLISKAHIELTEYIEHELLKPGSVILNGKLVSLDPHVNSVIELFKRVFFAQSM